LGILALATPAAAEVHINLNFGAPPTMLYLGEPRLYAAVGSPYDVFFVDDRYYYSRGADWYWAPAYAGPYTVVTYRSLPPALRNYRVAQLRNLRDREYRVYRVDSRRYDGRYFVADRGPGNRGRGNARGHHK
jgi:hypothetical protein